MEPTPAIQTKAATNGHTPAPARRSESAALATPKRPPGRKAWQVVLLPVDQIGPDPFQPRQSFDPVEMEELTASVKEHGVLQPVTVRTLPLDKTSKGEKKPLIRYHLVAGERRLRACKAANRRLIPAIIRDDLSDQQAAELALLENVQRSSLNVIEEANAYKRLMLDFRMKEERIAKKVGKSVATIKETLRLLVLPSGVQTLLARRQLLASHGHELLRLAPHPKICEGVALRCLRDKITATALATNPLPHAQELKRSGLVTELSFQTKFDWRSVCKECPHKALVSSGTMSYCLRPDEWKRKQDAAIEAQKQEAVRVMEQARSQGEGTVEVEKLAPGSFRRLLHVEPPAGCSQSCACRGETCDPQHPTRRIPVCLNLARFQELQDAQRRANEEERRRRYTREWDEAVEALQSGEQGQSLTAALLVWPILRGESRSYVQPDTWRAFVDSIAAHLAIEEPLTPLLEREMSVSNGLKRLMVVPTPQLLRLGASLLLGVEAQIAARYAAETPQLDAVLGREVPVQAELSENGVVNGNPNDEDEEPDESCPWFEDDEDEVLETEAAVEETHAEHCSSEQDEQRRDDEPRYGYPDAPSVAEALPDELASVPA